MEITAERILPRNNEELAGNLDTGFLKVLALVFMLICHMGVLFFPTVQEMRVLGRIAMPLYAWCLVVGNVKTRRPLMYCLRLLLIAVVSQPLYMMALNHEWNYFSILFLLCIATVAIQGIRWGKYLSQIWVPALCYLLLGFIRVDYGWKGLSFILLLYLARNNKAGLFAAFFGFCLFWGTSSGGVTQFFGLEFTFLKWPGIGDLLRAVCKLQSLAVLALPLILIPTHTRLRLPKWLGYAIYPLHLVLLIVLRVLLKGATWEALTAYFR